MSGRSDVIGKDWLHDCVRDGLMLSQRRRQRAHIKFTFVEKTKKYLKNRTAKWACFDRSSVGQHYSLLSIVQRLSKKIVHFVIQV